MMDSKYLLTGLVAALAISSLGCSRRGPEMGEVTGTVTYQGSLLPTGTILFIPEQSDLPTGYAQIREDGTYEAATQEYGVGIPVGKHRVMITAVKDQGPNAPVKELLPSKYSSDRQSGLTAEVAPGENQVDFTLK